MPTSREQLDEMLATAICAREAHNDPVGAGRKRFLTHVKELIGTHGFPLPEAQRLEACSMPFVFQELNYDDYNWANRTAELGPLSDMVEIDVIVWSGGRCRSELTAAEYRAYNNWCHRAIDYRSYHRLRGSAEPSA